MLLVNQYKRNSGEKMNVEILNVGTELLLGEIVNTNATFLQKNCKNLGLNVYYQTVVGDNPKRLYECLKIAFERGAHCVITTGGLGPTTDDLTKELSAQFLGLDLQYIEEEAKKVMRKCRYITGNNEVPQNNLKQAYFPTTAYILENKMGTANGCVMCKDDKMIINLPGPPKELKDVVENSLLPYLMKYRCDQIYTFEYITMFIGESQLDEILSDLIYQQEDISIALYAGEETVRIRLAVKALTQNEADQRMKPIQQEIEKRIGEYILKENDMKETLLQHMVPISLDYRNDFRLKDDFLKKYLSQDPVIKIVVEIRKEVLGEVVIFHFNDVVFEIPVFQQAELSYSKIEARFIVQLYKYIINL